MPHWSTYSRSKLTIPCVSPSFLLVTNLVFLFSLKFSGCGSGSWGKRKQESEVIIVMHYLNKSLLSYIFSGHFRHPHNLSNSSIAWTQIYWLTMGEWQHCMDANLLTNHGGVADPTARHWTCHPTLAGRAADQSLMRWMCPCRRSAA